MEELGNIEYVGSTTMEEVKDALAVTSLFLSHIDTVDFETAQKIMFMRLEFESFYKKILPFINELDTSNKESSSSSIS